MKYQRYSAYKNSGVERLGEVPAHWEVRKAAQIFTIGSGTTPSSDNMTYYGGDIPWITTSELRENLVSETAKCVTESAIRAHPSLRIHPKGSLAIAMYGATIGRLGILGIDATVNQACCIFSNPDGTDIRFMFYWFQMRREHLITLAAGGGQPNLSQELLRAVRIPLPPTSEQRTIAAFLDRETAQIDALIARQERLIAVLQEKRQALISHAVTKGLNPAAPMKDSGVEWLGKVPAHWKISKFASCLLQIQAGWTPDSEQRLAEEDEWAVVKVGCVRNGEFFPLEHKALAPGVLPNLDIEIQAGDLIMSRANTMELVGSVGLVKQTRPRLTLCDKTYRLLLNEHLVSHYANYLLQARVARHQIELAANGASASMKNISQESIRSLVLPIPPASEQKQLIPYLDNALMRLDKLVESAKQASALLQERRIALISAAVTGKIDVRNHIN